MFTLQNRSESVKVLKAYGMKTLRVIPGFNYVECTEDELNEYRKSTVNKAIIKESIRIINDPLTEENKREAQKALELNEKLNKSQLVIDKQNKQILQKDKNNDDQAAMIKVLMEKVEELEKLTKKKKKADK